eukprot:CAMPEP_0194205812 /NCGR_PEP_ID=MMETSP0156-20130528/5019_1 /TAXON_ID=33649 /ORGANISM="Thalassionema nitzschioides, Strain L26-B" /LENGTH=38 /DNA_ID= /DNA_START= /DNA_END= /DNA_ORIENTATION=
MSEKGVDAGLLIPSIRSLMHAEHLFPNASATIFKSILC